MIKGTHIMENTKKIWESKAFWGVMVSLLGKLAAVWGYEVDQTVQDQLISIGALIVSGFGDALALYGRVVATKAIK